MLIPRFPWPSSRTSNFQRKIMSYIYFFKTYFEGLPTGIEAASEYGASAPGSGMLTVWLLGLTTFRVAIHISATEIPRLQRYLQIDSFHPFNDRSCYINDGDPHINPYRGALRIRLVCPWDIYYQCSPVAHQYSKIRLSRCSEIEQCSQQFQCEEASNYCSKFGDGPPSTRADYSQFISVGVDHDRKIDSKVFWNWKFFQQFQSLLVKVRVEWPVWLSITCIHPIVMGCLLVLSIGTFSLWKRILLG